MTFFGELYLKTTLPYLSDAVTEREVDHLFQTFATVRGEGPLLDLGCGHGRHAGALAHRLRQRAVVGLELDAESLSRRLPGFVPVRGDLRQLPFGGQSFAGAYAWYSTLFVFADDDIHRAVLRGIHRVLMPGALMVMHTVPYEHLAGSPQAQFEQRLPDGSVVRERSQFDPTTGLDHGQRTLLCPDGRILHGEYRIRYYPEPSLRALFEAAGFRVLSIHGGLQGRALNTQSNELILTAEVPHV